VGIFHITGFVFRAASGSAVYSLIFGLGLCRSTERNADSAKFTLDIKYIFLETMPADGNNHPSGLFFYSLGMIKKLAPQGELKFR